MGAIGLENKASMPCTVIIKYVPLNLMLGMVIYSSDSIFVFLYRGLLEASEFSIDDLQSTMQELYPIETLSTDPKIS